MSKNDKNIKSKGNILNIFTKIFIVFTIIGILVWGSVYAVNFMIGEEESNTLNEEENITVTKKEVINALVCGISDQLTDTMIYVRYEVSTGKLAFMSLPRDTYVTNPYAWGHKLNSIYRGTNIEPLIEEVEKLIDVKIDYYLVVDNDIVREAVDVIGGVEINVPFRMKYTDRKQNLYIDLYPGVQVLNGNKAEQFIRYRNNNDKTVGYPNGDIGRTKAQQDFIKAFIKEVLSPAKIVKLPELIKTVLRNTETNVTVREALRYVTDVPNLKLDSIYSCTAPGTTPYINRISYFVLDKEEAKRIIEEEFKTPEEETSGLVNETDDGLQ